MLKYITILAMRRSDERGDKKFPEISVCREGLL
jgi:hypothetical protein